MCQRFDGDDQIETASIYSQAVE